MRRLGLGLAALMFPVALLAATPDIPVKDFDGRDRNVNEFIGKGRWVIVAAWAHDCHVCNKEIHEMNAFHDAHRDKDAMVLGITVDGFEGRHLAGEFVERHGLRFPNLIAEPEQEVMMKFGGGMFIGTPTYYIFTPRGDLAGMNVGPLKRREVEDYLAKKRAAMAGGNG